MKKKEKGNKIESFLPKIKGLPAIFVGWVAKSVDYSVQ